jgi:Methyltransferase domain
VTDNPPTVPVPQDIFWSAHYLRHNQRRQEHLASLGLELAHRTVLEVGAGIGDHTSFFLDRGCTVIVSEAQEQNLAVLRVRYPDLDVRSIDLDHPPAEPMRVDIVYCYGTLYHLERPAEAIAWMARCANRLLLLETCVTAGNSEELFRVEEQPGPEYAASGQGCRPTRPWLRTELAKNFPYVYCTVTQPWHEEFPLDWSDPELQNRQLIRSVFVASRSRLDNPMLTESLPVRQGRR